MHTDTQHHTQPTVLLVAPVMDALQTALDAHYRVLRLYEQTDIPAFLAHSGAAIHAVVTRGDVGIRREILEQLPGVGAIAVFGVGTDAIDMAYARQRNIRVAITAGVLTDDVADLAMGLLLAASRRLCQGDRFVREGSWEHSAPLLASKVSGKRIGIFGMGHIGQAIARRARGFDMTILYTDRQRNSALDYQWCADLHTLAHESDFLVVAASGSAENKGIIDASVFKVMPAHSWLINIARGSLVDEAALITALQQHVIAGAALDVFENEPHVPAAFFALDNVLLQPHVASATVETRQAMSASVLANLAGYFNHQEIPGLIK
ncbi:2-hydroxyacid dehydrogenase [Shimwellia blattae]|uniref:Putative D-isomer specific 2-hydroxyacid dehydrogenase family protein n=1 Tax=Shimwellia blattae (strain ATCC 29907 / DSM 4481 / JCM 1650 / NBRC 105725 / CDC 9005-74) TaxID=630626 RepID=I2B5P8_SHIBC|nr:2-hydroxyacid dehydrogenase [Shimwellia blattae]AFJ45852.1 putative D-isomer specific 2-hydroxyacid dehydrogenase family protein [Shimwellia blattae DSM 4481 = NBRC 105725]GAB81612.1 glyoxylate/hydroxypyruvate reductase B [Shimwellia blattae DSM 4481 = NBRC 105725]VDY63330.1 Putative 2-hydroxyacid dehydrogenase SAV2305 [Shimwellia blattae]VEC21117.1 Putative 2-hydroxyacid dehydrogenase SAV2305 [Shimwellia blattae]